jgi:hypothetical protein
VLTCRLSGYVGMLARARNDPSLLREAFQHASRALHLSQDKNLPDAPRGSGLLGVGGFLAQHAEELDKGGIQPYSKSLLQAERAIRTGLALSPASLDSDAPPTEPFMVLARQSHDMSLATRGDGPDALAPIITRVIASFKIFVEKQRVPIPRRIATGHALALMQCGLGQHSEALVTYSAIANLLREHLDITDNALGPGPAALFPSMTEVVGDAAACALDHGNGRPAPERALEFLNRGAGAALGRLFAPRSHIQAPAGASKTYTDALREFNRVRAQAESRLLLSGTSRERRVHTTSGSHRTAPTASLDEA